MSNLPELEELIISQQKVDTELLSSVLLVVQQGIHSGYPPGSDTPVPMKEIHRTSAPVRNEADGSLSLPHMIEHARMLTRNTWNPSGCLDVQTTVDNIGNHPAHSSLAASISAIARHIEALILVDGQVVHRIRGSVKDHKNGNRAEFWKEKVVDWLVEKERKFSEAETRMPNFTAQMEIGWSGPKQTKSLFPISV